jgi:hypothetical protein
MSRHFHPFHDGGVALDDTIFDVFPEIILFSNESDTNSVRGCDIFASH